MRIAKIKIDQNLVADKLNRKHGQVKLRRLSKDLKTGQLKAYYLHFAKGSGSRPHFHDKDQMIIGQKGVGQLVICSKINPDSKNRTARLEIKEISELKHGESVVIPAGTLHWHGATKNTDSSQISIMANGNSFWF